MENLAGVLLGLALAVLIVTVFVFVFRWLWNITMPDVFGIKTITFWQALRLLILAGILFGGHRVVEQGTGMGTDAIEDSRSGAVEH